MAIARQTDAKLIKPLEGSIVRRFTVGEALVAGEVAAMMADGFVDPAIGTSLAGAAAVGIALPGLGGKTAFAVGDSVDVVVWGAVQCVTGATPGAVVFVSDTAGEPAEAAGTKASVVGRAIGTTIVLVNPYQVAWA